MSRLTSKVMVMSKSVAQNLKRRLSDAELVHSAENQHEADNKRTRRGQASELSQPVVGTKRHVQFCTNITDVIEFNNLSFTVRFVP